MPNQAQAARPELLRSAVDSLRNGRPNEAIAAGSVLVDRDAGDIEARLILGLALACTGETRQAPGLLLEVARARPSNAHPLLDLAGLLPGTESEPILRAQFDAAAALAPEDAALACVHAGWLAQRGHYQEALARLLPLVESGRADERVRMAQGRIRAERGELPEAIDCFYAALARAPESAAALANLGTALAECNRFSEAEQAFVRALALRPQDRQIALNRAHALLKSGDYRRGWAAYEAALGLHGRTFLPQHTLLPPLSALGDLRGRRILLLHEQGLGDSLQFLRYAPLLAAQGAEVSAWVPQTLVRLVRRIAGVARVGSERDPLPAFDFHAPLMRLPFVFGTELATIPNATPYIRPDPDLVAAWGQRLPPGVRRIGLVWAGAPRSEDPGLAAVDRRRSMSLQTLAPLAATPHVSFISLQKGPAAVQARTPPPGLRLHDPMRDAEDMADTAAIIANLDLVVSVDTAVAHLAGAMGKPVFLLDRAANCWRWLAERDDSPWYPGLRIFRQKRAGDWSDVMGRVLHALRQPAG